MVWGFHASESWNVLLAYLLCEHDSFPQDEVRCKICAMDLQAIHFFLRSLRSLRLWTWTPFRPAKLSHCPTHLMVFARAQYSKFCPPTYKYSLQAFSQITLWNGRTGRAGQLFTYHSHQSMCLLMSASTMDPTSNVSCLRRCSWGQAYLNFISTPQPVFSASNWHHWHPGSQSYNFHIKFSYYSKTHEAKSSLGPTSKNQTPVLFHA